MEHWWDNHANVVFLVWALKENGATAEDIVYAVEKPWKFENEYQAARTEEET